MSLLDFARGPALRWSMLVMTAGFFWRFVDFFLRRPETDLYWMRKGFHPPDARWKVDSYAMHAGLLIVIFGFSPHILFIREFTGFSWPSLPAGMILFAAAITIAAMIAGLAHRMMDSSPSAFSAFDDYFTWTVVFAAMVSGILCYPHVGGTTIIKPYAGLLVFHLFAVELLMVWLPFGKLIHLALMPLFALAARLRRFAISS